MPSRGPPRRVRLWSDQACDVGSRNVSLATPKLSTQTSLTTSVRTQDLKRVMELSSLRPFRHVAVEPGQQRKDDTGEESGGAGQHEPENLVVHRLVQLAEDARELEANRGRQKPTAHHEGANVGRRR